MPSHPYSEAFLAGDVDRMVGLLTEDVVFHSPVISDQAFHGREAVTKLVEIVVDSLTDPETTHEAAVDGAHIIVFDARVLGRPVKSTTLLEFADDGRIREIWVMSRPLLGLVAIADAIGTGLVERRRPGRGRAIHLLSVPLAAVAWVTDRVGARLISDLNRGR